MMKILAKKNAINLKKKLIKLPDNLKSY